jgi:hypothetical protein
MVETLLRIVTEAFVVSSAVELTTSTDVVRQLADTVAVVVERGGQNLHDYLTRTITSQAPHTTSQAPHSASHRIKTWISR